MQLSVGERLEGSGPEEQPGGYVVTGVVGETPWYGLYAARKVFYNFDFTAKRVRETDEKEWLDVFLRTIRYPVLDQADYVAQRRALARAEVRAILGNRHSNLWPEPIDLVELEDARDPFNFAGAAAAARDHEPIVVFARPHGRFLPEWQEQILPLTSVLAVLAELLEFIRQAHEEGLLLLGLSPGAIVVDALERVHYVGTDMALAHGSPLLSEANGSDGWARFFPPERFPRGFAAPECFQPGGRPDRRSDLYSWACLAYLLLTGESPVRIAEMQGRSWASFHEDQLAKLDSALNQLPDSARTPWAEQLGLEASALPADWHRHVAGVLRLLLSANVNRRPGSVAELRAWLINLPPPALAGMVAVQVLAGEAKLLLDCSALDAGLRLRIRRGHGMAPTDPEAGAPVYDGPPRPIVVDGDLPLALHAAPVFYTAWTGEGEGGRVAWSAGVSEQLWQPDAASLRRWAEQQPAAQQDPNDYPARVAMVLGVLEPVEAAQGLSQSPSPRVRGWGLRRLEQGLRTTLRFGQAEPALWAYLRDLLGEIRETAAVALWHHASNPDEDLLLRLLEALEAPPLDSSPPLVSFLRHLGQSEAQIARLLGTLEQRRPTTCPLCHQPLTMRDRVRHLRDTHGYIDHDGDALPYAAVLVRLWERVLHQQDRAAHARLLELYLRVTPAGAIEPPGLPRYVNDLSRQVLGQTLATGLAGSAAPVALSFSVFEAYLGTLRDCEPFLAIARLLLQHANPRLRDLGRDAVLPSIAQRLRDPAVTPDAVWHALADVCPGAATIEERLRLCQRLPAFGVNAAAVGECAARLQDERLVECSECAAEVRSKDIETHLRRAHGVFEFRGVRRSAEATRESLVQAVCAAATDPKAWQALRGLAEDQFQADADRHLLAWLYEHLKALDAEERPAAVVSVAEAAAGDSRGPALLPLLVEATKSTSRRQLGRRIALELAARIPPPVSAAAIGCVTPLFADKELPRKGRQRALLSLLRTTGREGPTAVELLRAYVANSGKVRALEKLRQLEQRSGHAPAIDELCRELEDQVRMSCPRCPTQLRKREMVKHLWERHRLVLDGERVREPWRVLDDWIVDYGLEKDAELLRRCRDLARQDDPDNGVTRLYRMMLRRGIEDPTLVAALVEQAQARDTGLCPSCWGFVTPLELRVPEPLRLDDDVLEGGGFRLVVADGGMVPTLRVETPDDLLHDSREPGRSLTALGRLVIVVLPGVVLLFVLMQGLAHGTLPSWILLMIAGGIGIVAAALQWSLWPSPPPRQERLLRAAWDLLVPRILSEKPGRREWGFLHGLAQLTSELGRRQPTLDQLADCCEAVAVSGKTDPLAAASLAELGRLCILELRGDGRDVVPFLVDLLAGCLSGTTSLLLLRSLLQFVHATRQEWGRGELRRLQAMLAARAFAMGLSVDDLHDLARVFPVAKDVLGLEDRSRWAQLELLWSLSQRRAWEHVGVASSVFDLAESDGDGEALLTENPLILLSVRKQNLYVTSRGIWVLGQLLATRPEIDEMAWEWSADDRSYVIEIGQHRLRTPHKPRDLMIELKAWLRFYFDEFLPRLPTARRPMTEAALKMWQPLRASCPECNRPLVPCVGGVGISLLDARITPARAGASR